MNMSLLGYRKVIYTAHLMFPSSYSGFQTEQKLFIIYMLTNGFEIRHSPPLRMDTLYICNNFKFIIKIFENIQ